MTEEPSTDLPMFPLGGVLFPHAVLPLHVFEPRYRALTRDCLRGDREFGVVLIERGPEVGGGDSRFGVGTVARILGATEHADGRWTLLCVGTRRLRVLSWLPEQPYPRALVRDLPRLPAGRHAADALPRAEGAVRRALALAEELEEPVAPAAFRLDDDPAVAADQLSAIAPLGPFDRQRLLEEDDPAVVLRLIADLAEDAAGVLAYRLSGG